jgi:hypothetical protein
MYQDDAVTPADDRTACLLDISHYDTHGFCTGYSLRRHKFEEKANAGSHEARLDWAKYIGSTNQFGGCNPINGNFTALVLPLCRPERLRLVAYVLECGCRSFDMVRSGVEAESDSEQMHFCSTT